MDWFSWLSKTGLEPSLVYEYGLAFAQNELEQQDITYLNHEFLQSMGISIAKHRLEILKLARKDKGNARHTVSRLMVAIKRSFANYIQTIIHREESKSALVVVPPPRWKSAMVKRSNKAKNKQQRFLLTNGISPMVALDGFSSPVVYHFQKEEKMDGDDGYFSAAVEEIKWDTMFQDLKPN